jgi:hypothetical protein
VVSFWYSDLMQLGLIPQSITHLMFPVITVALWWALRSYAKRHDVSYYHRSNLAVSFWEEIVFRGLVFGAVITFGGGIWLAVGVTSVLFGLLHVRNLWWASRRQVLVNCITTALVIGPVLALVRLWTSDIYLGILLHFVNNVVYMLRGKAASDTFLAAKDGNKNWIQRLLSDGRLRSSARER